MMGLCFPLLQPVKTGSVTYQASYTIDTSGRGVKLTNHLHLVPGLMRVAIPALPQCLHGVVLR